MTDAISQFIVGKFGRAIRHDEPLEFTVDEFRQAVAAVAARAQGAGPAETVAWPEIMTPDMKGALELAFLKARHLASHLAAPKLYQALRAAVIATNKSGEA